MNNDVRAALERPFHELKTRPGRNGQTMTYIEGHQVIHRLNEAFGSDWSFRVLEHRVAAGEVIVLGELQVAGATKHAFGGKDVTKSRNGGDPVSLSDDFKAAATDALKKAATLLGVGLHLYGDVSPAVAVEEKDGDAGNGTDTAGTDDAGNRLSRKQHGYIQKLAGERGMDRASLDRLARDRYGKVLAYISRQQASSLIDEMRRQGGGNGAYHPG